MGLHRFNLDEIPQEFHSIYKQADAAGGNTQLIEVLANAPEILNWFFKDFYKKLFYQGRVDQRLKELVRLKLSHLHGCAS